jgi:hypothetical protein
MKPDNHLKALYVITAALVVLLCWLAYEFVKFMEGVL